MIVVYLNPSFAESIGPIVLPQEESFLTTKRCNSTPLARRATSSNRTIPGELVAYRALALIYNQSSPPISVP